MGWVNYIFLFYKLDSLSGFEKVSFIPKLFFINISNHLFKLKFPTYKDGEWVFQIIFILHFFKNWFFIQYFPYFLNR